MVISGERDSAIAPPNALEAPPTTQATSCAAASAKALRPGQNSEAKERIQDVVET
jgi:hypothetical protein